MAVIKDHRQNRGDGVYGRLKFESGGHRVRRVPRRPVTEGAYPPPPPVPSPCWSCAGNQNCRILTRRDLRALIRFVLPARAVLHVNTTDSAIRTHLPDRHRGGMSDERSQHKTSESAFRLLSGRAFTPPKRQNASQAGGVNAPQPA